MAKEPWWFQREAVESLYSYFEQKDGNPLIALPTGTGKSFVIAWFITQLMHQWPNQRILCLTHVHTLISQNYDELIELWPLAPAGICSAGLGQLDSQLPIIFGGVQSVVNRVDVMGYRDLLIIDETHLLSPKAETMYQRVIVGLKELNPRLKVIGLSATIWRLGQGRLIDDGIFTDVAYEMTSFKKFNLLLDQGYLVPPIPKRTESEIDLSSVRIDGYKFNEKDLDATSNQDQLNLACCREMCEMAQARRSWLIVCASIDHVEKINKILQRWGIDSDVVHSGTSSKSSAWFRSKEHNNEQIERWKTGKLRVAVSKDMLTTGVNNRACDFIGALRGLVSSSLWVQTLGRGTRTYPEGSKRDCLVADFARNTKRLGPINDPLIPGKPGKGGTGSIPVRICDDCGAYNHSSARICIGCGKEFEWNSRLVSDASEEILVRREEQRELVRHEVHHVICHRHIKSGSPNSIRVSYHVGPRGQVKFDEWVCLEHPEQIVRKHARDWWRTRKGGKEPNGTEEALARIGELKVPRAIVVHVNKKYPSIEGVEF